MLTVQILTHGRVFILQGASVWGGRGGLGCPGVTTAFATVRPTRMAGRAACRAQPTPQSQRSHSFRNRNSIACGTTPTRGQIGVAHRGYISPDLLGAFYFRRHNSRTSCSRR